MSPSRLVLQRLKRNPAAWVAGILLLLIITTVIIGPWFSPYQVDSIDFDGDWGTPPSQINQHWFGTDSLGRDVFVRTLSGGRISLLVAVASTAMALLIGVSWGVIAGYYGGKRDEWMMRAVDILYALPFLFLVILLMVMFGRQIILIFIAISAISWLDMARIVRGQALGLRQKEFILAARAGGMSHVAILRQHIVPNLFGVVAVYITLTTPQIILIESFLSFLGLGVQEPATSWGGLISDGAGEMVKNPWALLFPAGFMAVTLLCFNVLGDALRDALDPKDNP